MRKLFIVIFLVLSLAVLPQASSAQGLNTLSISQLQAIVASLQAQLNALIAQLNQIQQQENNSKPIDRIKPSITVTSPNGGESWTLGSTQKIKWRYSSSLSSNNRSVDVLLEPCALPTINDRICNPDGYSLIASLPVTRGEVSWNVGSLVYGSSVKPGLYLIRICVKDDENKTCDASDRYLKISDSSTSQSSITVTSPNGGEELKVGSNHYIQWDHTVPLCGDCVEPSVLVKIIGKAYQAKVAFININNRGFNWKVGESLAGAIPLDGNPFQIEACVEREDWVVCDRSDFFTITNQDVPSRAATIKVTVLKGGIYCIKAPCEFPLAGATVKLYDNSKELKLLDTKTTSNGYALFSNLRPGTYHVAAEARGYTWSDYLKVGLVTGQNAEIKTTLQVAPTSQLKASSELAAVLQSLQRVLGDFSTALGH